MTNLVCLFWVVFLVLKLESSPSRLDHVVSCHLIQLMYKNACNIIGYFWMGRIETRKKNLAKYIFSSGSGFKEKNNSPFD